jgi:rSAM/selenodomain-associated transferase 2
MRVSIIVPALNEAACIAYTLASLCELQGQKEIIVVDGGSHDETCLIARQHGALVITAPRGRGTQMREGASHATGEVLWFVHADTVVPQEALAQIESALKDESASGGNFGLLFDGDSRAAKWLTVIYPHLRYLGLSYGDSGIFVRRSVYEDIGGFNAVPLFEDLDLLRRLRKYGHFVHLESRIVTSSRRFEQRNFTVVWLHWTALQVLYWFGVPPKILADWYGHARKRAV